MIDKAFISFICWLQCKEPYKWKYWQGIKFGRRCLNPQIKFRQYLAPGDLCRLGWAHRQIKSRQYYLKVRFGAKSPNLIPANISAYMVNMFWYTIYNTRIWSILINLSIKASVTYM